MSRSLRAFFPFIFTINQRLHNCENSHLCRCTHHRVLWPHGKEAYSIAEKLGHPGCPGLKFLASPLETVILMACFSGGQRLELYIVLHIWRRYHHRGRFGELEENSLESCQTRRVQVLDHVNNRRSI